jgi:hypothetical protein
MLTREEIIDSFMAEKVAIYAHLSQGEFDPANVSSLA